MSPEYRYCPGCGKWITVGRIHETQFRGHRFQGVFCQNCIPEGEELCIKCGKPTHLPGGFILCLECQHKIENPMGGLHTNQQGKTLAEIFDACARAGVITKYANLTEYNGAEFSLEIHINGTKSIQCESACYLTGGVGSIDSKDNDYKRLLLDLYAFDRIMNEETTLRPSEMEATVDGLIEQLKRHAVPIRLTFDHNMNQFCDYLPAKTIIQEQFNEMDFLIEEAIENIIRILKEEPLFSTR